MRRRGWTILGVLGWAVALAACLVCWQTSQEARLGALTAIGHSEREVEGAVGRPDRILTSVTEFAAPPLDRFQHSGCPIHGKVLVYLRFDHAVALYLDEAGYVERVYWGRER